MLTLTRKVGQRIYIGNGVQIEIREVRGNQVRIGIVAPAGMPIMREELYSMMAAQNAKAAGTPSLDALEKLSDRVARASGAGTRSSALAAEPSRRRRLP